MVRVNEKLYDMQQHNQSGDVEITLTMGYIQYMIYIPYIPGYYMHPGIPVCTRAWPIY